MFIKQPNESFKIAFRSKIKGLTNTDFTVLCEKMSDLSTVELNTSVSEILRGEQSSGDYVVSGFSFAIEGDYLLSITSEAHNIALKTMISIRENVVASGATEENFGIIY
ncbi:MAG: hypothetical protein EOL93_00715 [Epsilonproteobacteria bacterium]|nr:hypothetical protein [Campylobacterota bacterium]